MGRGWVLRGGLQILHLHPRAWDLTKLKGCLRMWLCRTVPCSLDCTPGKKQEPNRLWMHTESGQKKPTTHPLSPGHQPSSPPLWEDAWERGAGCLKKVAWLGDVAQSVEYSPCMYKALGSIPTSYKLSMVTEACDPSTREIETGGTEDQRQSWLQSKFNSSLGYTGPSLKTNFKTNNYIKGFFLVDGGKCRDSWVQKVLRISNG